MDDANAKAKSKVAESPKTSPLTDFTRSDLSVSTDQSSRQKASTGFVTDDGAFAEETTHPKSMSIPSRVCSNFSQVTLYNSKDVFSVEVEDAIQAQNETSTTKFFVGVDVIYQTARKTFACVPLFCPARIFGASDEVEVYVGISYDGKGAYPISANFDSHGTFKNLAKSRNVVHTNFKRLCPTHIDHKFTDAEMILFEEGLKVFMKVKSQSDKLQGD